MSKPRRGNLMFKHPLIKMLAFSMLLASPMLYLNTASANNAQTTQIAPKKLSITQLEQQLKTAKIPFEQIKQSQLKGLYELRYQNQVGYVDETGQYLLVAEIHSLADLKKQVPNGQLPPFYNHQMIGTSALSIARFNEQFVMLSPDRQYILSGDIIRLKDMTDMTAHYYMQAFAVDWNSLPLKDAIKQVRGNGQHKVAVFSDPYCPYCKALEQTLSKMDNVTIYTFLFPIKPNAKQVSESIWCAKNPAQAWQDMMLNNRKPSSKTCTNPLNRNLALGDKLDINGTPALIFENGFKVMGNTSADRIQAIFKVIADEKK